jgi:hypothetical protein
MPLGPHLRCQVIGNQAMLQAKEAKMKADRPLTDKQEQRPAQGEDAKRREAEEAKARRQREEAQQQ